MKYQVLESTAVFHSAASPDLLSVSQFMLWIAMIMILVVSLKRIVSGFRRLRNLKKNGTHNGVLVGEDAFQKAGNEIDENRKRSYYAIGFVIGLCALFYAINPDLFGTTAINFLLPR